MLIRRGVLLDGRVVDVRVDTQIRDVAAGLTAHRGETVLDAQFGTVVAGLHDHHLHIRSAAAALESLHVGPPAVRTGEQFARALGAAAPGRDGWVRAIGYHASVAGDLDRHRLDALMPAIPVRVQHRSGVMWILNTPALARVGLADHRDGRLRSADHTWSATLRHRDTPLTDLGERLVAFGVTGVTDATPDLDDADRADLESAHRSGQFRPRVHFLSPGKKILHDDRLDLDGLTAWISRRHHGGHRVAVHCVTTLQLTVAMAALRAAGCDGRDRIEHAAVVPDALLDDLAALGVTVVTQPNFVAERGDQYRSDVPADELAELWRIAALTRAGVPVAGGTDAPFGALDPWAAMRAAVHRRTEAGSVLGPNETLRPAHALRLFLGAPRDPARARTVAPGEPGDLCVLRLAPDAALAELASDMVAATVIGGDVVYRSR